jgi:tmRNA-binding protein
MSVACWLGQQTNTNIQRNSGRLAIELVIVSSSEFPPHSKTSPKLKRKLLLQKKGKIYSLGNETNTTGMSLFPLDRN